jgi:hypothetical protein
VKVLSSRCQGSQREAALLLGQFENAMFILSNVVLFALFLKKLQLLDAQLKEMAVFSLGRLAQSSHISVGIVHNGGLIPFLELLVSRNGSLQHNPVFALYGLADNEDNISDITKEGGVQKLQDVLSGHQRTIWQRL